ncbi:MAG: tRNA (guanine-N1)-methyltransferase [Candidatus Micrarchaeota archaeon]|nr:tRNA (guanine-N1)-methyltransferase [Candidatus Micrarchaeota archaeon]
MDSVEKRGKSSIGYDLLGRTAIIEFRGPRSQARRAALELMKFDRRAETVLLKSGPVEGRYRTRKLSYIAGVRRYNVEYRENGCLFKFDPRKTFFSSRLSFERSRILKLAKDGEEVCVMFAGVGPFAIELAKKFKGSIVTAIEENPDSVRYMKDSITINKTPNAIPVTGDVKKVAKNYRESADRIIMPLPWSSLDFLDEALTIAKRTAVVHIYIIGKTKNLVADSWKKISAHAKRNRYSVKKLFSREVRTYSPTESEIVIDYRIRKL